MKKLKLFLKNRIFGNLKTTIAGLVIIVTSFILVWFAKATLTEVATFLVLGLALIGVKDPRTKNILKVFIFVALTSIFVGCSPQYRLNKLLLRHPELMQVDTLFIRDTVIFDKIIFDTTFSTKFDTITINKEKFNIKLIKKDSLIYLNYIYPSDTVYIERKITVDKIIYPTTVKKTNIWKIVGLVCIGLIFLEIILNIIAYKRSR